MSTRRKQTFSTVSEILRWKMRKLPFLSALVQSHLRASLGLPCEIWYRQNYIPWVRPTRCTWKLHAIFMCLDTVSENRWLYTHYKPLSRRDHWPYEFMPGLYMAAKYTVSYHIVSYGWYLRTSSYFAVDSSENLSFTCAQRVLVSDVRYGI